MIVEATVWNRENHPSDPWVVIRGFEGVYGENSKVNWNMLLKTSGGMDVYIRERKEFIDT